MKKQINLQSMLMWTGMAILALIVVFFIYQAIGNFSTVFGTIMALGAIGFFGWFFLEHIN
ncbi:hypothetical protein JW756_05410 [Candidatus Woesearchaeota archaeon]|nr:hypothetical protein [Candidatus Woesearchaeota archaeon]